MFTDLLNQAPQANTSSLSNTLIEHKRRDLVLISALIEHPTEGLILFETGGGRDYPEVIGTPANDIFARIDYTDDHDLNHAIAKTGHNICDIKAVIMGHLHLDHAGGLKHFQGTNVPIYVHELELKHAFYTLATKSDEGKILLMALLSTERERHAFMITDQIDLCCKGVYDSSALPLDLNWQAFHGSTLELASGINLHHSPGHTPGLCILQLNLQNSGAWVFTSDQYHVEENYHASHPQGWLARDHDDWVRSHQMIKALVKRTGAKLVFGHCSSTFVNYEQAPRYYQ
ncbi:unnamed protein product [Penicillium olsonii]|uniref:Metallo-beta-lactamase domain-containing protein n=1 Tax=Penicillium olsonii TaxID=99116 RepID=A0A9W4HUA2_PENOL|nr:unnamed protein product [Penicillium olsonii]CAG8220284.1 unnamed protein product [Penicillium olsonii]